MDTVDDGECVRRAIDSFGQEIFMRPFSNKSFEREEEDKEGEDISKENEAAERVSRECVFV